MTNTDKIIIGVTCVAFGGTFVVGGMLGMYYYKKNKSTVKPVRQGGRSTPSNDGMEHAQPGPSHEFQELEETAQKDNPIEKEVAEIVNEIKPQEDTSIVDYVTPILVNVAESVNEDQKSESASLTKEDYFVK